MPLTLEQRAFIAGYATSTCAYYGIKTDVVTLISDLEEGKADLSTGDELVDITQSSKSLSVLRQRADIWLADDTARRAEKLAAGGVNLAQNIKTWGLVEWNQAVTAMALYHLYLKAEHECVIDFLASPAIQEAPQLKATADQVKQFGMDQCRMIDPVWAAKLIRRMIAEITELSKIL